jgi:cation:H+ antiporter
MNDYVVLLVGVAAAAGGGELFVRGAVGLAAWARVPAGLIGVTVAAFATSSPELAVSTSAALEGRPEIGLGDALGSNVVNVGVVLAAALLVSGLRAPLDSVRRDFPVALLAPLLTAALALDGVISRLDGALLLAGFVVWLATVVAEARRRRSAAGEALGEGRHWLALCFGVAGLALLLAAGRLIVSGAKGIAASYGLDEFVVGATVVALGTSAPELATALVSKLRGHDEVGLGAVLGSNIFNNLWIVGVAAAITPIVVGWRELAVGLAFGLLLVGCTFPARGGAIGRRRGALLLFLYAAYLVTILQLTPLL